MSRFLLIVSAAFLASASAAQPRQLHIAPFSPVGECPGHQEGPPTFLPDSNNCTIYYECSNGVPIQNHCADGLEWNPTLNTCDTHDHANCQAGKPKKIPKAIFPFSPVGKCPEHQGQYPVYLPDSKNCSIFYECDVNGNPLLVLCPPDLEFNPILHVCDFPSAAGCTAGRSHALLSEKAPKIVATFSPVGQCPEHQGQYPVYLPDSKNCSIFYECDVNGNPLLVLCPPDLEFNPILHVCDFPSAAGCTAGRSHALISEKAPKIVAPFSPVGQCPEHQGQYPVYLPDSKNCSIFYECDVNGVPIQMSCPPELEFNPIKHICDFPSAAGCAAGRSHALLSGKAPKIIAPFSPVGQCPEHQGQYPVYLPDSKNCSIFYECDVNGNPLLVLCPPDLEFNPILHVCDFPSAAGCTAGRARKPVSKRTPKAVHPFSPVGGCPEHEGQYPVYLPDSKSCSIFYQCDATGVPIQMFCPPELEFNPIKHVCDYPSEAGCTAGIGAEPCSSRSIVGQCPEHDGQYPVYLPDNEDCSAFYECSNGVPIKLYCADGTLFDSVSRRCRMASEATCQTCSS